MKYNGKNITKPLRYLFQERSKWFGHFRNEEGAFEKENAYFEPNLFEKVFYQRVNNRYETIIPKEEVIKTISDNGNQIQGINFAVDAFKQFKVQMALMAKQNPLALDADQDPYLSSPIAYYSYVSPSVEYENYANNLLQDFHEYIKTNKLHNSITQFKHYVKSFLSFLSQKGPNFPLTMTGWQKSVNSNIFTSGLAFSIAPLKCGDDTQKEEFVSSPLFSDYVNLANEFGFFVLSNCPWIMVAGTRSGGVKDFSSEYDQNTEAQIYTASFETTYINDINNIKIILYKYYNIYINLFPYNKELYYNGNVTKQNNVLKLQLNENDYSDLYWLKFYNQIRNIEENMMFNKAEFDVIEKKLTFFAKKLDKDQALSYINEQYRFFYVYKPGGINDFLRKRNQQPED